MRRGRVFLGAVLSLATLSDAGFAAGRQSDGGGRADLPGLVRDCFLARTSEQRDAAVAAVVSSGATCAQVAAVLAEVNVWSPESKSVSHLVVDHEDGRQSALTVRLPAGYAPDRAYPAMLYFHDPADATVPPWLEAVQPEFEFIVVTVVSSTAGRYACGPDRAGDPRDWVLRLRRAFHTDVDRLFVGGRNRGADAALAVAMTHPDLFAGAVIDNGFVRLPYPRDLLPVLSENLRRVPTLVAWRAPASGSEEKQEADVAAADRRNRVALSGWWLAEIASRGDLPVESVVTGDDGPIDAERVTGFLAGKRRQRGGKRHLRFRYPDQGRSGLVRCGRFAGLVWRGDQIHFFVPASMGADAFRADTFRSKLGLLAAEVDDNVVRVTTTHCKVVQVFLTPDVVDFERRIRVYVNGKRRFDGKLTPSVETMLESALDDWDLAHPAWVRLRIGRSGPAVSY